MGWVDAYNLDDEGLIEMAQDWITNCTDEQLLEADKSSYPILEVSSWWSESTRSAVCIAQQLYAEKMKWA